MFEQRPIFEAMRGFYGGLEIVQHPLYKITLDKIKGLENALFTQSLGFTNWPDVSILFSSQKAILQSAQEAAAFKAGVRGNDYSDEHQLTRTTAIYFKQGNKYFVAFDDIPDQEKNLALKVGIEYGDRVKEYLKRQKEKNAGNNIREDVKPILSLSIDDSFVMDALERARLDDRLHELPKVPNEAKDWFTIPLHISYKNIKKIEKNPISHSIFGRITRTHIKLSKYLYYNEEKYQNDFSISLITPKWINRFPKNHAVIMSVSIGHKIAQYMDVFAYAIPGGYNHSEDMGYARGVKNSPGFLK